MASEKARNRSEAPARQDHIFTSSSYRDQRYLEELQEQLERAGALLASEAVARYVLGGRQPLVREEWKDLASSRRASKLPHDSVNTVKPISVRWFIVPDHPGPSME
jgi:hypothetical protein